ncbi:MAG: MFS transporter, partial [Chloroflexota bacterium]
MVRLPWRGIDASAVAEVYPLYFLAFTVQLGMGIVAPILPELMADFSLSAWQVGMVVTVFGLARLITDLPLGLLLDRIDRTRVLVLGTLLIMAGSTASGLASDYAFLLAARLVMGTGSALCTVTTLFSLSRAAGEGSRGKVIGLYQAALIGGATFSPVIGGAAAALVNWRASFFFCSFTGLLALLLVLVASGRGKLRLPPASRKKEQMQDPDDRSQGWQLPWNLLAINLTSFVFFFSMAGFRNSVVPLFGGKELGIGAGTLGLLLGGSAVVRFLVTLGSGVASDRYGRKV